MTVEGHEGSEERAGEGFGTTSRKKVVLLYGGLTAAALVVLQLMLTWLTRAADDPRPLISRVSSSSPMRNMKKIRPTSASTLRNGNTFGENR